MSEEAGTAVAVIEMTLSPTCTPTLASHYLDLSLGTGLIQSGTATLSKPWSRPLCSVRDRSGKANKHRNCSGAGYNTAIPHLAGCKNTGLDEVAALFQQYTHNLNQPELFFRYSGRQSATMDEKETERTVGDEPVTSVLGPNEIPILEGEHGDDDDVLAALGYK